MIEKPSLLLHSCCGPCSTAVIERLIDDYHITVYFYNPNIQPQEEYELRLLNQQRFLNDFCAKNKIGFIEGSYEPSLFLNTVKGHENEKEGQKRCELCFRLRLSETAMAACKYGFDLFTTTLTVSPHKNAALINGIGREAANRYSVKWLYSDFKKKDGYLRSIRLSKEYGLYRQNYCGCIFSRNDLK